MRDIWQAIKGLFAPKPKPQFYDVLIWHSQDNEERVGGHFYQLNAARDAEIVAKQQPDKKVIVRDQSGAIQYVAYGRDYQAWGYAPPARLAPTLKGDGL